MTCWLNLGQMIKMNSKKFPKTIALKEKDRSLTYTELNKRVNKLSHSLLSLGLKKGDKFAVLLENSIEIVEAYLAAAKTGLIIVPVHFRFVGREIVNLMENSDAKAFIVHEEFVSLVNSIKDDLINVRSDRYIVVGNKIKGYLEYEDFIKDSIDEEPEADINCKDTWIILYTSGTTGIPKGVVRSHESYIAFFLINSVDFGFNEHDVCLNVMPLYHVNSTFYTFLFLYIGGTAYIHPARHFRPEEILEIIEKEKITYISLIPTHYNLILNAPENAKKRNVASIRKLLCSSAPVTKSMKKEIMKFFPGVELYEAYGSTEAGLVTLLKPEDQMRKLGSIGYEAVGTDCVKLLDENGNEVGVNEIGELYSRGPMMFDEYYKMPEKTKSSFLGEWFSAGDMAMRDNDGFYYIVDRKDNMIITGGEHVYPTEVQEIIVTHPDVFDVAVIGLPHDKWGEQVTAVIVPKENTKISEEKILDFCRNKISGYKRPKKVIFIKDSEMPRTPTGKILHRILRERYNSGGRKDG
ncbi:MAG: long-chain fatty acid--CoA ligase [Thermoplasmatales archaeon SG8-52-3]|nr:MAG: long-chain fatty acid--CoA ligase [Thermoplasmatales archaeon SG8-52-3]